MGNYEKGQQVFSAQLKGRYLQQAHTDNLELIFRFFSRENIINDYTLCILFQTKEKVFFKQSLSVGKIPKQFFYNGIDRPIYGLFL